VSIRRTRSRTSASEYADRAQVAREAGAAACLSKSRAVEELISTIHAVAVGENFISVV
jgi:DNA-binding NarL/FixJ family response regulator